MRKLTQPEKEALLHAAMRVGVEVKTLAAEIEFESGWNPQAKNPLSSARGLIQFMDATAVGLGFQGGSAELVERFPTAEAQLRGPVIDYLWPMHPFPTDQSLFMAVFYPAARHWGMDDRFPANVREANPGITTVGDYVRHVWGRVGEIDLEGE